MGKSSWMILGGSKDNHMHPYKKEREGKFTTDRRREHKRKRRGNVAMEAEIGVMWLKSRMPAAT